MKYLEILNRNKLNRLLSASVAVGLLGNISSVNADAAPFYESRGDHYRTGANLQETVLNTTNVNASNFGLLFTLPVSGVVIAQSLYAPNITINNVAHNVIYIPVSTTAGGVGALYAYDADQPGAPLWIANFNAWTVENTPIIDPTTNTLYVVTRQVFPSTVIGSFKLHALDLVTGAEKFGGPKVISATFSAGGNTLNFASQNVVEHAGLALTNGHIILSFGTNHEGTGLSYSGWVLSYSASTLQQTGVFATIPVPPATGGGIWQSGRAPVVDDNGYVYLFVGNAYLLSNYNAAAPNGYDGVNNFSESLLKFDSALNLIDWFTPGGWPALDAKDNDLSSSGPLLIPGTNLLTGGGKDGNVYLWNTNNLGKYNAQDAQVVQKMPAPNSGRALYSGPVFWTRSSAKGGSLLFTNWSNQPVFSFSFNGSTFNTTPVSSSSATEAAGTGYKNAIALSANGDQSGSGIIWEFQNNKATGISVMRAFDAENLGNELWNSSVYPSDSLKASTLYIPPTISNGKVYAPTLSGQLVVYGLIATTITQPANQQTALGNNASLTVNASDSDGDTLVYSATGLPVGLSINSSTGVISGMVTVTGIYSATVSVSNNKETPQTTTFTWTVSTAPALTQSSDQSSSIGNSVTLPISATDNGLALTYTASGLPAGLAINQTTGVISGAPFAPGSYAVTVTAANQYAQSSSTSFNWTVPYVQAILTAPTNQTSKLGSSVNVAIGATDLNGLALVYSATGLPLGLTINANTGAITGTPSLIGNYHVVVSVADSQTPAVSKNFTWTIVR